MATPYAIVELHSAHSTQDEARSRRARDIPVLVVARHQPAGRGRLGRDWVEPDLALFSSIAFEPAWPVGAWGRIPLVAGLAVKEAIDASFGIDVGLRWPNDVVLPTGKVGGLLAESSGSTVVVGCGINLVWDAPVPGAAALHHDLAEAGRPLDLAVAWVDRFFDRLTRPPDDWGIDEYRRSCVTIGRSVSYAAGTGRARSISEDGALVIETPTGPVSVTSGEVRLHDPATIPFDRGGS
ncbi:MAG: biotin--[acetyl-CoA-carboxylase] ligase [Acidimicrobiia bacterium]